MRPLFSKILRGCIVPSSRQFSKKAKRSPIPSLARSADVSKVLSDQHSSVIFKDVHCMTDFLSAVLGRPAAIEGSPIAPRTVHLRGVPGKAKQFSYGFSLVLNDPSPEATKRVTHIFRHVLLEGQNGFQDSVAARALIHLTVDRYETFANLVTEKGIAIAAAKKAAEAAQASGSTTGGIADTACSGGVTREHGASNAVQIASGSFVELPPAILVTVQDFVPVKLKSADVVSSALSRGVSMAAVNSWLSERVIGSDECFEHPATNLQLDDAGGLVVDLRMDLPPNTAVLPMAAVSGGATGAIQAFVLLTVPVAGCTEPVVSMKFAMEAPRPLANGAAVHAYEPSAMASLRNHDHYVFVFLPLLVCGAATLKGLWRHGGGGSDDDLDRLRKWALLFLHRPAKTDSTPPCVSNDPLLSRLLAMVAPGPLSEAINSLAQLRALHDEMKAGASAALAKERADASAALSAAIAKERAEASAALSAAIAKERADASAALATAVESAVAAVLASPKLSTTNSDTVDAQISTTAN